MGGSTLQTVQIFHSLQLAFYTERIHEHRIVDDECQ